MIYFTTVLVTYADRANLLKKVITSTVDAGCNHIIIIDNGSVERSMSVIDNFPEEFKGIKFSIFRNDNNEGSAVAFSSGMDIASSEINQNEYVLFLDDDNLPEEGSIQRAIKHSSSENEKNSVYFLLREDRPHYLEFIRTNKSEVLLGEKNSFMAFTISKYIKNILGRLKNKGTKKNTLPITGQALEIPCGPYGGMLTRKSILLRGLRPLKEMVLYFDDTKYTYDLSLSGVKLFLLTDCFIKDIDDSWSAIKTKKTSSPLFEAGDFKITNTIRNRVFFELSVTTDSRPIYLLNIFCFMSILFVKAVLSNNIASFCKIAKSIYRGFKFYKQNPR
ncbi:glycosyltransferase family 2 protein [Hafnia paralvei]|uniref:glycosyltransferase family 2 protein n=1 Tax=Hafnia paralvei TaxID=546367 RepID=UPI0024BAEC26|nr:glycosyltransferase [Hafnia paralvei]